jgi:hypothetical protein
MTPGEYFCEKEDERCLKKFNEVKKAWKAEHPGRKFKETYDDRMETKFYDSPPKVEKRPN